eukprot:gene13321-14693_t
MLQENSNHTQPKNAFFAQKQLSLISRYTVYFVAKNTVEQICQDRKDVWAVKVNDRVKTAIDLHAADVVYHKQCSVNFRTGKDIPSYFAAKQGTIPAKKVRRGRPLEEERVQAFERVIQYFEENDEEQLTIQCLAEKMEEYLANSESEPYSTFHIKKRLLERFGKDVVIAEINGRADVVTMRPTAARIFQEIYHEPKQQSTAEEETRLVKAAAALIKNDIKACRASKEIYSNSEDMSSPENAIAFLPQVLLQLLDVSVVGVDKKKKIASIGLAIMQAARPRVLIAPLQLGLAVQMHHHFG